MATVNGDLTQQSPKRTQEKQLVITLDRNSLKRPELPQELILDILLRLPVKSLFWFKSACKSWCTMISRLQFVKKHLRPYGYAVNLNYLLTTLCLDARIGGSCDALVYVYFVKNYDDIIYRWNQTTGKRKIFPSFGKGFILSISYGFGYDSSNDDYKVVRISNFNDSFEVKIYSLRTDSWRKIQDFPSNIIGFHSMDSGKLANGSLNWVGINPSDHSWVITALDLAEETYRDIPQPNYGKSFLVKYRSIYGVPDFHEVEIYQESLVSPDDFMKMPIDLNN
ncbi:F-box/kelch-repeat protein At3g23880-like [Camellia sinensis]|uniref:F-box/kelch-repeat protein At3g23880-like n=1 Tax=Camellia sinensis TaxID=4442 RepID=UPI0010369A33|nr:F-box/kelch-repeat protein At3g23880-like [Camellia sinensis]